MKSPSRATWADRAAMISISTTFSQTPAYAARPQIWGYCIAWCAWFMPPAFAGTTLYCLVIQAHRCEQLAEGCSSTRRWLGLELVTTQQLDYHVTVQKQRKKFLHSGKLLSYLFSYMATVNISACNNTLHCITSVWQTGNTACSKYKYPVKWLCLASHETNVDEAKYT